MAVQLRWRDQGGQMIDQRQRREGERRGVVALGAGQAVDDPLLVDPVETLECEGRARTVTQQIFGDTLICVYLICATMA
jgi:hypothetical protein